MAKPKGPAKADLVMELAESMSPEQWELISRLRGFPIRTTTKQKALFLNGLLVKTRTISTRKSIARNLQQWVCNKISQVTGLTYGKDEHIASREMGQSGADVRLSKQARREFPFTVECKSGMSNQIPLAAIRQAQANLYEGTEWLVVLDRPHPQKDKRVPPVVVIAGEVFFRLLKEIKPNGGL